MSQRSDRAPSLRGGGARSDAQAILQSLAVAETDTVAYWRDQLDRAWTALLEDYGELRAAATWLWRHEPNVLGLVESLYSVSRPRRRGRTRAPPQSGIDASSNPATADVDSEGDEVTEASTTATA